MTALRPHPTPAPVVVDLPAAAMRSRLPDALSVYVAAMDYPRGTEHHRAPMWAEHTTRPGWQAVAAVLPDDSGHVDLRAAPLVAIAYGYHGAPQQWWHQQVHTGMRRCGWSERAARELLSDYFELTELHVHPDAQGRGLGEVLLARLLADRPERSVLLSTPEVPREGNRAWRLYRRRGFTDVVRHFVFAGDTRAFAVLGRTLPMPAEPPHIPQSAAPQFPAGGSSQLPTGGSSQLPAGGSSQFPAGGSSQLPAEGRPQFPAGDPPRFPPSGSPQ